jgi:hypothetical protein
MSDFTSEQSERLHKQGVTLLGEERLSPREDVKLSLTAQ